MNKPTKIIIVTAAIIGSFILGVSAQTQGPDVYAICMKGHNEYSQASEDACGQAQDAMHSEFLCSKDGSSCWVEAQ